MHYSLWMLIGAFMFSAMGLAAKLASATYTSPEMIFYRGLVSLFLMWLIARQQKVSLATKIPYKHAWRSFIGGCALLCNFYAITKLPLATAMTLNYMSSLWVGVFVFASAIAMHLLKHKRMVSFPFGYIFILIISFIGVVLLLRPTIENEQLYAGLIGLVAGMLAALAYLQVAQISKTGEPEIRTVFYFSVGCIVIGGSVMLVSNNFNWDWHNAIWLLPIGVFATFGQICLTKAYALAKTQTAMLTVANLQYMGIVFSALLGFMVFKEQIHWLGWLGIAIIISSGVLSTHMKQKR